MRKQRKHPDGLPPSYTFRRWLRLHLRDDGALGVAARHVEATASFPGGLQVTRRQIQSWAAEVDADDEDVDVLLGALDAYLKLIKKSGAS